MKKSESQENERTDFDEEEQGSLKKVGALIQGARLGKDLSIEELAKSIRISKEQLIALEAGDEKKLPERVFVKAMVRRIAEKLSLSLDTSLMLQEPKAKDKLMTKPSKEDLTNKVPIKVSSLGLICIIVTSSILGIGTSILLINHLKSNQEASLESKQIFKKDINQLPKG